MEQVYVQCHISNILFDSSLFPQVNAFYDHVWLEKEQLQKLTLGAVFM